MYSGACPSAHHSSCTLDLCLDDGCYDVSVSTGSYNSDITWTIGDDGEIVGEAPYEGSFWVNAMGVVSDLSTDACLNSPTSMPTFTAMPTRTRPYQLTQELLALGNSDLDEIGSVMAMSGSYAVVGACAELKASS